MDKYDFSLKVASKLTSTIFIIAALSCSVFGLMSDKVGYRVTLVICASTLIFLSHFMFLSMPNCHQCYEGLLPMVCIGISYSIYSAALWPMIPIVIKEEYLGTAFGITLSIQNAGLGFGPNIVGLLTSMDSSYDMVLIFFMVVSGIGIVSGFALYFISKMNLQNILQLPSRDVQEILSAQEILPAQESS
jgi:MFS family permease